MLEWQSYSPYSSEYNEQSRLVSFEGKIVDTIYLEIMRPTLSNP